MILLWGVMEFDTCSGVGEFELENLLLLGVSRDESNDPSTDVEELLSNIFLQWHLSFRCVNLSIVSDFLWRKKNEGGGRCKDSFTAGDGSYAHRDDFHLL